MWPGKQKKRNSSDKPHKKYEEKYDKSFVRENLLKYMNYRFLQVYKSFSYSQHFDFSLFFCSYPDEETFLFHILHEDI